MKTRVNKFCVGAFLSVALCALAAIGIWPLRQPLSAQETTFDSLGTSYGKDIQPLVAKYCQRCHSGKQPEATIDFKTFATLADVRKSPRIWQKVLEMLDSGQMPPKDAKQPTEEERTKLQAWVRSYLKLETRVQAGDPGRVVLRRLSNAEYTYTVRDLTGVNSLQPAREFPVDGAAGEGFTNTGAALSMSPALFTKYLDAGKRIAKHAVLLPDGIRFSPSTTRQDWTNEVLAEIRAIYNASTESSASTPVKLQGLVWDAKQGGRVPIEKYLHATLVERDALKKDNRTIERVAAERGLSAKYLRVVWQALDGRETSLLLDDLRARWRVAHPEDAGALAVEISRWQNALWKFSSVGHIGKVGGPKAWMEPIDPLVTKYDVRFKIPATKSDEVTLYLVASKVEPVNDLVVWQQPKFVAPGRPELLLKDLRHTAQNLTALRADLFTDTAKYLLAADEAATAGGNADVKNLAKKHGLEAAALAAWLDYVGIGSGLAKVQGHFTKPLPANPTYKFIQGWGRPETPVLVANSSDQHVRIPGNMKPRSVAVHPSPKLNAVVGWQSPVAGKLRVAAKVGHAHPECGDGVSFALELRRGATRQRLAVGIAQGTKEPKIDPVEITVKEGDLISVVISPRTNHSCDLTAIDLTLSLGDKTWDLAKDVSGDVLAGNPHADRLGNKDVWHFYTEPVSGAVELGAVIPSGSLLDRWRVAVSKEEKSRLAAELQRLLTAVPPDSKVGPDASLYRQLASLNGPLLGRLREMKPRTSVSSKITSGLDPALFGRHPSGAGTVEPSSLCVKAPSVIEIRLPAELVAGYEFVTSGVLHADSRQEGAVQLQVLSSKPPEVLPLQAGVPFLVAEQGTNRQRIAIGLKSFRELFPPAVCYTKIVPVDEVVTLTLFFREDHHLTRLMLDDAQKQKLDRLWDELEYISHFPITQVDAFNQLMEFATQDSDPRPFEPLRKPINARAAAFKKRLVDTQSKHLDAVIEFAGRAYRRPLAAKEKDDLTGLYNKLRKQELTHEDALRMTLARVLVSPAYLYRLEAPGPDAVAVPVTDLELASRLSYFLWSSTPDAKLTEIAVAGKLRDPEVLAAQTKRMLQDPRVRRLATEFGCQWLHIRGFDEMNEKSERHFPTFAALRGAMYQESILFFTDLFQRDRPVLDILDADYAFVNEDLAKHYGIPGVVGKNWRRIEGAKKYGRGGILGQATTLATQSGASRTSPILRGNWVSEVLLGEKLPRPPKGVPQLPEDETKTEGLTVRQLVEKHSSDPKCSICHRRIDAYGFALEGFDAIGRRRDKDLANRPIETRVKTMDGAEFDGIAGLRDYLLSKRKDAFVRQFCRKLLGYALARGVQLSDEPLLDDMQEQLQSKGYRVTVALDAIVRSKQFREIRGSKYPTSD
ncbi:MAG: DUF1592 domain-containing protein [Gemmataceae bacterium]|nr:DUF1592 domain-containing protein [Gemmataceae bacterium]